MSPLARCLWLACLAAASVACTVSDALDAAPKVADAVNDSTKAVGDAAEAAAATVGLRGASTPPAAPKRTDARAEAAGRRRTSARRADGPATAADEVRAPSAPERGDAIAEGSAVAAVPRESVEDAPPILGAAEQLQAAPAPALVAAARPDRIYSDADAGVTPAVLLTTSEAGPIFRGVQGPVNTMELLISRDGMVEHVRLLTPATRMTDMLLLSGAKTWKFAPALKDGQPVRYRTRFSWESTP